MASVCGKAQTGVVIARCHGMASGHGAASDHPLVAGVHVTEVEENVVEVENVGRSGARRICRNLSQGTRACRGIPCRDMPCRDMPCRGIPCRDILCRDRLQDEEGCGHEEVIDPYAQTWVRGIHRVPMQLPWR